MKIRCSCGKGFLEEKTIPLHDVSELLGFATGSVALKDAPALVCSSCDELTFSGEVIATVTARLTTIILRNGEVLRPQEVSFLRGVLGLTQTELAERLGFSRPTIARWERDEESIGRAASLALRTIVAAQLGDDETLHEILAVKRTETRTEVPYQLAV